MHNKWDWQVVSTISLITESEPPVWYDVWQRTQLTTLQSNHTHDICILKFKKNLRGFEVKVSWKLKSWWISSVIFYSALFKAATMRQISRLTLKTVARQQLNVIQLVNATVYILQCLYFAQVSEYQSETKNFVTQQTTIILLTCGMTGSSTVY